MPTTIRAKDLAKIWSFLRTFKGLDIGVEHTRGAATHTLSHVTPGFTSKGRPTAKLLRVVQDGRDKNFDGNYEFDVTAFLIRGKRFLSTST